MKVDLMLGVHSVQPCCMMTYMRFCISFSDMQTVGALFTLSQAKERFHVLEAPPFFHFHLHLHLNTCKKFQIPPLSNATLILTPFQKYCAHFHFTIILGFKANLAHVYYVSLYFLLFFMIEINPIFIVPSFVLFFLPVRIFFHFEGAYDA